MTDVKTLKNDDFRKLLATPSVLRSGNVIEKPVLGKALHSFTHRQTLATTMKKPAKGKFRPHKEKVKREDDDIFAESQAQLNELMKKYRDRAAERRKGLVQEDDAELKSKITAAYKAMPSTASATASMAERRRLEIQESKYLGGDMEHTHLVKGLDYSLLNKVRDEIENAEDNELEQAYEKSQQEQKLEQESKSRMAKSICRIISSSSQLPKRNDMFSRGRMAYVVELDPVDDAMDDDVPCTLLRSVADCPSEPSAESSNTDTLLINKLEQVLGYLRADMKKRKKGGDVQRDGAIANQKIYDDADEYAPSKRDQKPSSSSHTERREKGSYFENRRNDDHRNRRDDRYNGRDDRHIDRDEDRHRDRRDRERRDDYDQRRGRRDDYTSTRRNATDVPAATIVQPKEDVVVAKPAKRRRIDEEEDDAYAELYPSGIGLLDAVGGESDEEDFSKMDMGNRKGPIKRWDFETEKEYESYQEKREAMPKAAYQYGIKMNSGRKTRKNNSAINEKKLDRELDKINKILDDRKKQGK